MNVSSAANQHIALISDTKDWSNGHRKFRNKLDCFKLYSEYITVFTVLCLIK